MKGTQQIRKSINKAYRFDNTNSDHIVNFQILTTVLFPLSIIAVIIMANSPWPLYIWGMSLVLIIVLFKLYNRYHQRYFRLIKRTEQSDKNKIYTYHVQTFVSIKNLEKVSHKSGLKWRDFESFTALEEAEWYFDKRTKANVIDEDLIYDAKKAIHKPRFHDKFVEENNLSRAEINALRPVVFSSVLYIVFLFVFSGITWLLLIPGIAILLAVMVYIYYGSKNHRYYRMVERIQKQGRYENRGYVLQTFISKESLEEILSKKDIKWNDIESDTSKETIQGYFERHTTQIKMVVTDEVL